MHRVANTSLASIVRAFVVLLVALAPLLATSTAGAMPNFTRKYHQPCIACHDAPAVPRLNAFGYKFRRAGFRMPDQIGHEELSEFNAGDYFAARIQARYTVARTVDRSVSPTTTDTNNTFELRDVTLYPITGSFQKHWATETEISLVPDGKVHIENAFVRWVWGTENFWVESRAGVFHPFEGFGASDRPIGASRPLFETSTAVGTHDTLYRIWGIDRVGAEVGGQWKDTSLSVAMLNELTTAIEGGKPAGAGISTSQQNSKDLLVFFNQILGARSGISAYWAHGATRPPVDVAGFVAGTTKDTWRNAYDRIALFASVGTGWFTGLAGGGIGFDQSLDATTGQKRRFRSGGAFVEGDFAVHSRVTLFTRLDYFDPSASASSNHKRAITAGATVQAEWVYVIPELQLRSTAGSAGDKLEGVLLAHAVAIY